MRERWTGLLTTQLVHSKTLMAAPMALQRSLAIECGIGGRRLGTDQAFAGF